MDELLTVLVDRLQQPQSLVWLLLGLVPFAFYYALQASRGTKLPILNSKTLFEFSDKRIKENFANNGRRILREGLKKFPGKPFKVLTDFGYATVLPPEYVNEVRNIDAMSHVRAIAKVYFGGSEICLFFCCSSNVAILDRDMNLC